MALLKQLNILTFFILTLATTASCQTKNFNKSNQEADTTVKGLRSFQQIFWDSLPEPTGYVNDYENLYTDTEEKALDSLMSDFRKSTTIQIVLITFDTTMTTKDSLESLTLRILNAWGVGQKDKNNGIVVGISSGYRKMRIQNGYGIERILTNSETKEIIDTAFIPGFKEGKYFEGTLTGLKTLMATLLKNAEERFRVEF
ncbi:MAG: TPM domain-containing protein [Terrimonas sp.]|nr:TPM domain-containing protein [Terrimonas sp.]